MSLFLFNSIRVFSCLHYLSSFCKLLFCLSPLKFFSMTFSSYVCMYVYVYVCVCVCVCVRSCNCRIVMDRDRVNIVLTPVFSSYFYYFCCCVCVHVCLLRANAVVLVVLINACIIVFFPLSFCLTALCSAAKFFFVFFCLFFSCCLICLCVCVSQNEDQHNVLDVYLFFFSFGSLLIFFSHYILTYLKYTLNSLYKQKNK
jgi:hypothetical protein